MRFPPGPGSNMFDSFDSVGSVLFLVLLVCGAIAFSMRSSVLTMLASPRLKENPGGTEEILAALPGNFRQILAAEGFQFSQAYSFHGSRLGFWLQSRPGAPLRTFCLNRNAGGTTYEFGTDFSDEADLTTTMTRAAFVFPLPYGRFMQSFPGASAQELWTAHRRGEEYILSALRVPVAEPRRPFLEGFEEAIKAKLHHVTSHRLWFVRGIYWYLVKRFILHNRPIWEQDVARLYGAPA